jgi:hypothetical protein
VLSQSKTLGSATLPAPVAATKKVAEDAKKPSAPATGDEPDKRELSAEERVMNEKISAVEKNSLDKVYY